MQGVRIPVVRRDLRAVWLSLCWRVELRRHCRLKLWMPLWIILLSEPHGFSQKPGTGRQERALGVLQSLSAPADGLPELKRQVDALVAQLGGEQFIEREKANRALSEMPPAIVPILRSAARGKSGDVASRVRGIMVRLEKKRGRASERVNDAVDVLIAAKDKRLFPPLLKLMDEDDARLRYCAAYGIRRASGQAFGFDAHGDAAARARALARWNRWWARSEVGFDFAQSSNSKQPLGVVIADDSGKEIVLVDMLGNVLWSRAVAETPQSASVLANGNYLIAHKQGAVEYDRHHKKVSDIADGTMIYDIERLANGNTLLCYVSSGHVTEVDKAGRAVWKIDGLKSPGAALRQANGRTLISVNHGNRVIEVGQDGKISWEHGGLNNPSDVSRLANGNVLVAEWGNNRAFEVDRTGKEVWSYKHSGNVNGARRLADGTTVIAQDGAVVLVDANGQVKREIHRSKRKYGKVQVVPIPKVLPDP